MFASSDPRGGVLRLHKMHGSTNWGFGGLTGPASDRIVLTNEDLRWVSHAQPSTPKLPRYASQFDDLYPLIVPPTFSKGPYYGNLALRGQWRRAWGALRDASDVSIIGYSFPLGDLTTREWLGTAINSSIDVSVVDLDTAVAERVRTLTPHANVLDRTGKGAVEAYVDRVCGDHLEWEIEEEDNNPPPRISVLVNGVEVAPQGLSNRVWGAGLESAKRWVHSRVEAAGSRIETSLNLNAEGLVREHRIAVLPPGHRFIA